MATIPVASALHIPTCQTIDDIPGVPIGKYDSTLAMIETVVSIVVLVRLLDITTNANDDLQWSIASVIRVYIYILLVFLLCLICKVVAN